MATTELVNLATSEKLAEVDWAKNIEICELVAQDQRLTRDVIKAIKKRLGNKSPNVQLYAVLLLEMLMNNIGENVHQQVIDTRLLPVLVKIVKKKSDFPVRERIFLLLDATQTSLGGASGKFPQYYNAYYDLVSSGVQFPQRSNAVPSNPPASQPNKINTLNTELASCRQEGVAKQAEARKVPESSIIEKATNALDVLREVLDAVSAQNPEGAKDEFTLDLVEQCSFQKQRVMHLIMTSRDEKIVSRAIELNEQLQRVLTRHDALLSGSVAVANGHASTANQFRDEEADEEEEQEQLFRRIQKGKACARPEDEDSSTEDPPLRMLRSSILEEKERLNRPLIRPLPSEPSPPRRTNGHPPVVIPPPPAKHMEREKYFQEKKVGDSGLAGHVRGLSLHSRNGSSSRSGSVDYSE